MRPAWRVPASPGSVFHPPYRPSLPAASAMTPQWACPPAMAPKSQKRSLREKCLRFRRSVRRFRMPARWGETSMGHGSGSAPVVGVLTVTIQSPYPVKPHSDPDSLFNLLAYQRRASGQDSIGSAVGGVLPVSNFRHAGIIPPHERPKIFSSSTPKESCVPPLREKSVGRTVWLSRRVPANRRSAARWNHPFIIRSSLTPEPNFLRC